MHERIVIKCLTACLVLMTTVSISQARGLQARTTSVYSKSHAVQRHTASNTGRAKAHGVTQGRTAVKSRSSRVRLAHHTKQPDTKQPAAKASKVAKGASDSGSPLTGIASVYSGEKTANGEYAHANGMTAAHRSLPFGTLVKVTNKQTGKSVVVRINDRGPYVHGRVIDLMPAASKAIGSSGLAPVSLAVVGRA